MILAIAELSVLALPAQAQEDAIGLYFDIQATTNCLTEVEFPLQADLYLVLKGCQATGGVGAWECTLEMPAGASIVSTDYLRDAINFRVPPEFVVGLSEPIPQAESIPLAKYSILFLSPGGIIVHGCARPSLPNAAGLVYADGADLDRLVATGYVFGGPLSPAAAVGDSLSCPEPGQSGPALIESAFPGEPVSLTPTTEFRVVAAADASGEGGGVTGLPIANWYESSDLGFLGTIVELEAECVSAPIFDKRGVGRMRIAIDELYWGPSLDIIDVFAQGVYIEGCMAYSPAKHFAAFDSLTVGAQVCAAANYQDGRFWTRSPMFEPMSAQSRDSQSTMKRALEELRSRAGVGGLYEMADCVVEVEPAQGNEVHVLRTIRGSSKAGEQLILDRRSAVTIARMALRGDGRVFCFLVKQEGEARLVSWNHGAYFLRDGAYFDRSGLPVLWRE